MTSYCSNCIHHNVCGNEGVDDVAMTFCADKQTDGDLISRTDLLNKIWQKEYGKDYDGVNLLNIKHIDIIEQMPSAEKTAEWVGLDDYPYEDWECDNCGHTILGVEEPYRFCPNCGADMRKEQPNDK